MRSFLIAVSLVALVGCSTAPSQRADLHVNVTAADSGQSSLARALQRESLRALRSVTPSSPLTVTAVVGNVDATATNAVGGWREGDAHTVPSVGTTGNPAAENGAPPTVGGSIGGPASPYAMATVQLHGTYEISDASGRVIDHGPLLVTSTGAVRSGPIEMESKLVRQTAAFLRDRVTAASGVVAR